MVLRCWLLLSVLGTAACGWSSPGDSNTGYSQVVIVSATGIGGTGRAVQGRLGSVDEIPVTIELQNRSGGAITVVEVEALVLDSTGTIHARTILTAGRNLADGLDETYRGSVTGKRPETSVLGVRTRIRDEGDRPRASMDCSPLCLTCDPAATQRACEQFRSRGAE